MKLFKRKEKRSADDLISIINSADGGYSAISAQQAINIPSVASCVNFIANTIAGIPIKLYKESDGVTEEISENDDKRLYLLNTNTGDTLSCFEMRKAFVTDYLLSGEGYIYINRQLNDVQSLNFVKKSDITKIKNKDPIFKSFDIIVNGNKYRDFEFIRAVRNTRNGIDGVGVVEENPLLFNTMYSALLLEKKFYESGGKKGGFGKTRNKMDKESQMAIKSAYETWLRNPNTLLVLSDGFDIVPNQATSAELQLNQNKQSNSSEVCAIFNCALDVIAGKASYDVYCTTIKTAVIPIIREIENALNRDLLLLDEQSNMYFAFDTSELMRGDFASRVNAYNAAINGGWLMPSEVRYKEDLSEIDGLDLIKFSLGNVFYDVKTKQYYIPNTDSLIDFTSEGGGNNES